MSNFKSDANTFLSRTFQKTKEVFNSAEKTPLDAKIEDLIKESEKRRRWAESLITQVENVIQPNPALRVEDMVLKGLDRKKERINAGEQLGESMEKIGELLGANSSGGDALRKCGEAQIAIGQAEHQFQEQASKDYLEWLRNYVANEVKQAKRERDNLENARLDLDRLKAAVKNAKSDKKAEHERSLSEAQTVFDQQNRVAEQALRSSIDAFDNQKPQLMTFLRAQEAYFESCANAVRKAMS